MFSNGIHLVPIHCHKQVPPAAQFTPELDEFDDDESDEPFEELELEPLDPTELELVLDEPELGELELELEPELELELELGLDELDLELELELDLLELLLLDLLELELLELDELGQQHWIAIGSDITLPRLITSHPLGVAFADRLIASQGKCTPAANQSNDCL